MNDDLWSNDEVNSEFVSAIKLALDVLDAENGSIKIDEGLWAAMVYTFEEREWAIQEEEEGEN